VARASVCCEVHARDGNDVHHRDVGQVIACTGSGGASSSTPLFCGHNDRTRTVARVAAWPRRAVPRSRCTPLTPWWSRSGLVFGLSVGCASARTPLLKTSSLMCSTPTKERASAWLGRTLTFPCCHLQWYLTALLYVLQMRARRNIISSCFLRLHPSKEPTAH